jgi:pyridoxal phosphate enzyme (YggS family)
VLAHALHDILQRLENAGPGCGRPTAQLVAVSKTRTATEVAELAAALHALRPGIALAFGENYVQEARAKQADLARLSAPDARTPEWHLIGHLQSNKAKQAATLFDWVQTVDRETLVRELARHRPAGRLPLNVLIQVNIDDEASKHGCSPADIPALAAAIGAQPRLALRGLMAIPAPLPDLERRRDAFRRMRALFEELTAQYPQSDTLSMGMSEDFELAIAEGATMVRIGTALFGRRTGAGNR